MTLFKRIKNWIWRPLMFRVEVDTDNCWCFEVGCDGLHLIHWPGKKLGKSPKVVIDDDK
jgi:hypothetical protein